MWRVIIWLRIEDDVVKEFERLVIEVKVLEVFVNAIWFVSKEDEDVDDEDEDAIVLTFGDNNDNAILQYKSFSSLV